MCEDILKNVKTAILTLGCKVNTCESDAMAKALKEAGASIVDFDEKADIYIVNTCSVTNIADRKSRQMLHKAKKMNPEAFVIACGCYVQGLTTDEMKALGVDAIIGNNRKGTIVETCLRLLHSESEDTELNITEIGKETDFEDLESPESDSHTRAFIKIQDGCNQFCTYCIIPYVRGRIRSRAPESVLSEVGHLADKGFQEVVLNGIHLSSYEAYGEKGGEALLRLIEKIAENPKISRIRLGSLEPRVVTAEFADRISQIDKLCPQFHLSLQSGSDTVLKRMNRKYNTDEYRQGVAELRRVYGNPAITTDIIVGFPQETEEEFRETMEFAREIAFSKIHVFRYSRRRGTVADKMPGQVQESIKEERSKELMALEEKMGYEYFDSFLGKEVTILTEEEIELDGKKYMVGLTERYVRVAVLADGIKDNCLISVKATGRKEDILIAE